MLHNAFFIIHNPHYISYQQNVTFSAIFNPKNHGPYSNSLRGLTALIEELKKVNKNEINADTLSIKKRRKKGVLTVANMNGPN